LVETRSRTDAGGFARISKAYKTGPSQRPSQSFPKQSRPERPKLLAGEDNRFALLGKGMYHAAFAKEFGAECIRQIASAYDMQPIELLAELGEFPDRSVIGTFKPERERPSTQQTA
jgi:hypothetical protein